MSALATPDCDLILPATGDRPADVHLSVYGPRRDSVSASLWIGICRVVWSSASLAQCRMLIKSTGQNELWIDGAAFDLSRAERDVVLEAWKDLRIDLRGSEPGGAEVEDACINWPAPCDCSYCENRHAAEATHAAGGAA